MSRLLDQILSDENMEFAQRKVYANSGAGGVDGVTVEELSSYMEENWESIRAQIKERTYKPQPVLRVEIPKPSGGVRNLGIPTVVDRTIQQAIAQQLSPRFDCNFSKYSYGFRPHRRCEQAIVQLLEYFNDGYTWIVDIDLEKFFDNVPQDKLMSYVHEVINDPDTESLIRKFLQAGVMVKGVFEETTKAFAFRLSEEDFARFQILSDASGKVRQDYLRECVLECKITVYPNIRVRKYLERYLLELGDELRRVRTAEDLTQELLNKVDCLLNIISQL